MKWSWKICRLAGIDVFLHWTFLLLIGWILASYLASGRGLVAAMSGVGFVVALFGCVVLHELGHALAARRFDVPTRDITLYPIGGVARLERIPEHPYQEFVIAIAGPLVNVGVAIALALVLMISTGLSTFAPSALANSGMATSGTLANLLWANLLLATFNLIPAFPMDGGRILRAGLASIMDYSKATQIAATVGQGLAILFAFAGLFYLNNPLLLFVAFFIYLGASSESQLSVARSMLHGIPVRDAMMTRFEVLRPEDSLHDAARELLAGTQQDFPVADGDNLVGMLRRSDLARGLSEGCMDVTVADAMSRDFPTATTCDMLERAMMEMDGSYSMPVVLNNRVVGLVDTENIGELMMIRTAMVGVVQRSKAKTQNAASTG